MADVLSVLGMTYADENRLDSLKYRLLAPMEDPGSWGHEYVRHLALEIGAEFTSRQEKEEDTQDLTDLTMSLIPFFLKHNAEADAVDLLLELEIIDKLPPFLDENTYQRVGLYMIRCVFEAGLKKKVYIEFLLTFCIAWYLSYPPPMTKQPSRQRILYTANTIS